MDSRFLEDARKFAEKLAVQAAEISRSLAGKTTVEIKPDASPVTEADRQIQRLFLDAVVDAYPDHAFLGEESIEGVDRLPPPSKAPFCWVVDPLDGTRNFARGFPIMSTSIALMNGAEPVVAVVREHLSGWCCSAVAGRGARCNGRPARVADRPVDADTLIAVPSGRHQPILPTIKNWLDRYVLRNVGSTAAHMAYVATGAVDAAFCYECKLWDVAAGALLIREAGGRCTDLSGKSPLSLSPVDYDDRDLPFIAASPRCFDQLLDELVF